MARNAGEQWMHDMSSSTDVARAVLEDAGWLAALDLWWVDAMALVYSKPGKTHDRNDAGCEWALGQLLLASEEFPRQAEAWELNLWRTERWTCIHKDTGNADWHPPFAPAAIRRGAHLAST